MAESENSEFLSIRAIAALGIQRRCLQTAWDLLNRLFGCGRFARVLSAAVVTRAAVQHADHVRRAILLGFLGSQGVADLQEQRA